MEVLGWFLGMYLLEWRREGVMEGSALTVGLFVRKIEVAVQFDHSLEQSIVTKKGFYQPNLNNRNCSFVEAVFKFPVFLAVDAEFTLGYSCFLGE
jgi:hypothetical protein